MDVAGADGWGGGAPLDATVVVRSCNRLPALVELLEALLAQAHDRFEVVVVEQSRERPPEAVARLETLARDPRLRILDMGGPIGGARARNVGARAARGRIVILVDDDDLPVGRDWIARHVACYDDPDCLGISGRQVQAPGEAVPYGDAGRAYRRCLMFSPVLRVPWTYVRVDRDKHPVDTMHGTNASIRRSALERFGGWDEDTRVEDEASLCYRIAQRKRPSEYLAFRTGPVLLRRLGIQGGLAKRFLRPGAYFERVMDFFHVVVGRYHPWRVALLHPLYVAEAFAWTVDWLSGEAIGRGGRGWLALRVAGLALEVPWRAARCVVRRLRAGRGDGGDVGIPPRPTS